MSSVPFHYLDFRTFCYETEDPERVKAALRTILPEDIALETDETKGHHGDRILVFSARIETADDMRSVLNKLRRVSSFEELLETAAERVDDDCAFYFRLDKQLAYTGEVALGTGIQLRGKVEAYPASRDRAVENLTEYLESVQREE